MTAFFLQMLLLMSIAFFIGAALACLLRRTLAQDRIDQPLPVETRVAPSPARPVDPLPEYAQRAAPKPAPVMPAPTAPAVGGSRFDDALAGKGAAPVVQRPAPAPPVTQPVPQVVKPVAPPPPVVAPVAPSAAVAPAPVQPTTVAPVSQPIVVASPPSAPVVPPKPAVPAAETIAAAAAVAAAAAAAQIAARAAQAKVVPAAAIPVPQATPAKVVTPVAAPISVPTVDVATPTTPATVAVRDDLKLIRSIDASIEGQINKLGFSTYRQLAQWKRSDVLSVNQALGFKGRVEQENWIEQAQVLASGGETEYSRRVKNGERIAPITSTIGSGPQLAIAPIVRPAATVVPPVVAAVMAAAAAKAQPSVAPTETVKSPIVASAPVAQSATTTAAAAAAASAAAHAAAAAAARNAAALAHASTKVVVTEVVAKPMAEPLTHPHVEERAAFARSTTAVVTPTPPATHSRIADAVPSAAPSAVAAVATSIRPGAAPERDDLQRINGINAEIERALAAQNVTRYTHISGWASGDVERFDRLLGSQGRIARENWVEQAQILAKGGDTAHSRDYDRQRGDSSARPVNLAAAIRANTGQKSDVGGLRSVRSEIYRSGGNETTAAAAAAAASVGSAKV
ncbi:MAG: hypothetical protein HOO99_14140, partial [Hyphomicrobiaceae bacterium]|nr:hypothetical protein [Hyphomicrobiaceae bacterium]